MKKSAFRFALVVGTRLANTVFAVEPNMPPTGPAGSTQSDFHGIEFGVRVG